MRLATDGTYLNCMPLPLAVHALCMNMHKGKDRWLKALEDEKWLLEDKVCFAPLCAVFTVWLQSFDYARLQLDKKPMARKSGPAKLQPPRPADHLPTLQDAMQSLMQTGRHSADGKWLAIVDVAKHLPNAIETGTRLTGLSRVKALAMSTKGAIDFLKEQVVQRPVDKQRSSGGRVKLTCMPAPLLMYFVSLILDQIRATYSDDDDELEEEQLDPAWVALVEHWFDVLAETGWVDGGKGAFAMDQLGSWVGSTTPSDPPAGGGEDVEMKDATAENKSATAPTPPAAAAAPVDITTLLSMAEEMIKAPGGADPKLVQLLKSEVTNNKIAWLIQQFAKSRNV